VCPKVAVSDHQVSAPTPNAVQSNRTSKVYQKHCIRYATLER
jgi:hypothetical protein